MTQQVEAEEHGSKDHGGTLWWKLDCCASKQSVLYSSDITRTFQVSAPCYPAGATTGTAPG